MAKGVVCIDTDVCVDFLRGKDPGFTNFIKLIERFEPCITAITAFELHLGHIKMKHNDKFSDFIALFIILPFDLKAAVISAKIQASLDKKGKNIGISDTLIAGICIANNIPLMTLNTKHFSRIAELELIETY